MRPKRTTVQRYRAYLCAFSFCKTTLTACLSFFRLISASLTSNLPDNNNFHTYCLQKQKLPLSELRTNDSSIQIFIKTLTGRKQAFNFEPENQVLVVKQALQEKEGIQVDQIRLIHSGKQLADDKTLESYNIAAGATIHMVLQLRGGSSN